MFPAGVINKRTVNAMQHPVPEFRDVMASSVIKKGTNVLYVRKEYIQLPSALKSQQAYH